jgi:hypothetical protein
LLAASRRKPGRILRNRISAALAAALAIAMPVLAAAYAPSVAQLDSAARATGNRKDVAERIGAAVFTTEWPAEVSQISANELAGHLIVGIRVLGVKFHRSMTRDEFASEVVLLLQKAFAAAPGVEEIDLWASVPIAVAKGVIVSGDLAKPTSRTVFSVTVRRGESVEAVQARILSDASGVFWDQAWSRTAFVAAGFGP